ncbi:MAG TPA: hypothetical protein PKH54_05185 [Myxococcota bacterium]|nr:hypothetical protein [Myxococcota bacterium]HOC99317.1 hypothetical protein [Myxococcota bacterium]HOH77845.1 hypothetical protein [Myxococcota bacterium]HPV04751.1 hypothetical protein [Myxococcota bacterium]
MTRKAALLFVAVTLMATGAVAAEGNTHIGFQGQFIAYGVQREAGVNTDMQVPSGGLVFFAEYGVLDYIALGGQIEYGNIYTPGSNPEDPFNSAMRNFMGFSGSMRVGYPFLDKKNLDVYVRLNVGYGLYGLSQQDLMHGWVARAMPGVMYTTKSGFAVFAEIGWAGGGFINESDNHVFYNGLAIDFGIGWKF